MKELLTTSPSSFVPINRDYGGQRLRSTSRGLFEKNPRQAWDGNEPGRGGDLFVSILAGLQLPVGGVENLSAGDVEFSRQGFGQRSGAFYLAVGGYCLKAIGYRADSNCPVRAVPVFAWQAGPLPPPPLACLDMSVVFTAAVADDEVKIKVAAAGKAG